jgi:hypothetical protein
MPATTDHVTNKGEGDPDGRTAAVAPPTDLPALYEQDETAWLERMADLAADRRHGEMDFQNLSEYLTDMARRDRREVFSRLVVLLAYRLKWDYQPGRRSPSWRKTMRVQRRELRQLLRSGTLRRHAGEVLADAYTDARLDAAEDTGLPADTFPAACPWGLDELLAVPDA